MCVLERERETGKAHDREGEIGVGVKRMAEMIASAGGGIRF